MAKRAKPNRKKPDWTVLDVFEQCVASIRLGELIHRVSRTDKEYHFQNWFQSRLTETGVEFEVGAGTAIPISAWSRQPTDTN